MLNDYILNFSINRCWFISRWVNPSFKFRSCWSTSFVACRPAMPKCRVMLISISSVHTIYTVWSHHKGGQLTWREITKVAMQLKCDPSHHVSIDHLSCLSASRICAHHCCWIDQFSWSWRLVSQVDWRKSAIILVSCTSSTVNTKRSSTSIAVCLGEN